MTNVPLSMRTHEKLPAAMKTRPSSSPGAPALSDHTNLSTLERVASFVSGGALTLWSLRRFSVPRLFMAATGGLLATRGLTGRSRVYETIGIDTAKPGKTAKTVRLEEAITVHRPRDEVYGFWRDLTNLPRVMPHLERVEELGGGRSRWTANIPRDLGTLSWEAEITEDEPGVLLAWTSRPDGDIQHAGRVRFEDVPGPYKGTVVSVDIRYSPPPADVGPMVAELLKPLDERLIREDLRRFRQLIETGEIPTTEGQPACR